MNTADDCAPHAVPQAASGMDLARRQRSLRALQDRLRAPLPGLIDRGRSLLFQRVQRCHQLGRLQRPLSRVFHGRADRMDGLLQIGKRAHVDRYLGDKRHARIDAAKRRDPKGRVGQHEGEEPDRGPMGTRKLVNRPLAVVIHGGLVGARAESVDLDHGNAPGMAPLQRGQGSEMDVQVGSREPGPAHDQAHILIGADDLVWIPVQDVDLHGKEGLVAV